MPPAPGATRRAITRAGNTIARVDSKTDIHITAVSSLGANPSRR